MSATVRNRLLLAALLASLVAPPVSATDLLKSFRARLKSSMEKYSRARLHQPRKLPARPGLPETEVLEASPKGPAAEEPNSREYLLLEADALKELTEGHLEEHNLRAARFYGGLHMTARDIVRGDTHREVADAAELLAKVFTASGDAASAARLTARAALIRKALETVDSLTPSELSGGGPPLDALPAQPATTAVTSTPVTLPAIDSGPPPIPSLLRPKVEPN